MNESDVDQYIEFRKKVYTAKRYTDETHSSCNGVLHNLKEQFLINKEAIYLKKFNDCLNKLESTQIILDRLLSQINNNI